MFTSAAWPDEPATPLFHITQGPVLEGINDLILGAGGHSAIHEDASHHLRLRRRRGELWGESSPPVERVGDRARTYAETQNEVKRTM